ncbi:hypothetical protein [Rhodococcus opacus]|uniref:hypothetical protein n=1 Tax=Rhodococcus opacus TaxID=37919 RepID=UPI0024BA6082|nr:hypothetical protein [Rhodococcus opacus]MDJ0413827.1 hypothetical protein [Rhodococcus opacus]
MNDDTPRFLKRNTASAIRVAEHYLNLLDTPCLPGCIGDHSPAWQGGLFCTVTTGTAVETTDGAYFERPDGGTPIVLEAERNIDAPFDGAGGVTVRRLIRLNEHTTLTPANARRLAVQLLNLAESLDADELTTGVPSNWEHTAAASEVA